MTGGNYRLIAELYAPQHLIRPRAEVKLDLSIMLCRHMNSGKLVSAHG